MYGSIRELMKEFSDIHIQIDSSHTMIFNPNSTDGRMVISNERCMQDVNQYQIVIQPAKEHQHLDMVSTPEWNADITMECMTKNEFNQCRATPFHACHVWKDRSCEFGSYTHIMAIYYGHMRFMVYVRRGTYSKLKTYFKFTNTSKWKRSYFRFTSQAIFSRLLVDSV